MNKEEITKKLNEYVKSINDRFTVTQDRDLNLSIGNDYVAYFEGWDKSLLRLFEFENTEKAKLIAKTGIVNKFYTKTVELINEMNEMNNDENIKHRKRLAIRALEDVLLGSLRVEEYRECAGVITLKLERGSEENG